jgi:hypothetical protein
VMSLTTLEDFREFTAHYPVAYVAVDPHYGDQTEGVPLEEFLDQLEQT